jgi:hypothetical protein
VQNQSASSPSLFSSSSTTNNNKKPVVLLGAPQVSQSVAFIRFQSIYLYSLLTPLNQIVQVSTIVLDALLTASASPDSSFEVAN